MTAGGVHADIDQNLKTDERQTGGLTTSVSPVTPAVLEEAAVAEATDEEFRSATGVGVRGPHGGERTPLAEESGGGATLGSTTHYYGLWDGQLSSDDSADSICYQSDDEEELDWGQEEDDY